MSKQKKELPIPLRLVREYSERYLGAYALIKKMREEPTLDWDKDKCFIPIAATIPIVDNLGKTDRDGIAPSVLAALAAWREYKEIYHFDYNLAQELYLQADDVEDDIPVDVLNALPYPCIYIELDDDDFQGFFVFWEQDFDIEYKNNDYELRFLTIGNPDGGLAVYHLHICGGGTIKESTERTAARMKRGMALSGKNVDSSYIDMIADMQSKVVLRLLQLVLYICAENSEVEENPEQKQITRRSAAGTPPKDVYREIRKWDVGVKIGKLIRSQKYERSSTHGEGSVKRPHVRRGHYHHYWVGSDKDNSKHLILRWVAPVFVNAASSDDIIVTENKVT